MIKKYIILNLLVFSYLTAQDSDTQNALINKQITEDIKVKIGGRTALDFAHYINDYTDMSSGAQLGEARLNMAASFTEKFDFKFSVDFGGRNPENTERDVEFKDIYLRWNINDKNSLRVGHFSQPFSAGRIISGADNSFIARSATTNSLTEGRRLGIAYKTIQPKANLWAEASIFGGDIYKRRTGDDAIGIASRVVYNPNINPDTKLHFGIGFSTRNPDANNFKEGDDDYNRKFNYSSTAETLIDRTHVIGTSIDWAKRETKLNAELIAVHKNFMIQGEYTQATVSRERDNKRLFEEQLGGMFGFQTLESWEKWYGKNLRNIKFNGFYLQTAWIIKGGDYIYNSYDAVVMAPKQKGVLELVARFNQTDLNDIDGIWYNGKFYDPNKGIGADNPNFNYSIAGGKINTYTLGLNYYLNKYIRILTNYGYSDINNLNLEDKYAHVIQTRLQINF